MTGREPTHGAFADAVLAWFDRHGRHDLPWQRDPTPYRVWVSEVMLQQTQVTTVIGYFERFTARFPDVGTLAEAPVDDVLHLWSGLGYYSRARNLHEAARLVRDRHAGVLPGELEALVALPGIGRSTAGAILALSMGVRHPILDGNVKRVLARYHAIEGWPGRSPVMRELWRLAEHHTPGHRVAAYTQAMMDLGATVCVRSRPLCPACPLAEGCRAYRDRRQHELPARKPRSPRPLRSIFLHVVRDAEGRLLLERRPPTGVWGGLWSFPESTEGDDAGAWCEREIGIPPASVRELGVVRHGFTHFELDMTPVLLDLDSVAGGVREAGSRRWYDPAAPDGLGLPAPIARLVEALALEP